jgi:hypothetical protein
MLEQLMYVSRATPGVGARDAYDIIRTAHNRNSQLGLTGGLIFADGYFIQVLEGHGPSLQARFAAIAADPRHTDVDVRHLGPITGRCFPSEWMGLRHGDAISDALKQRFAYAPGLPANAFPPPHLLAFVDACYQATVDLAA